MAQKRSGRILTVGYQGRTLSSLLEVLTAAETEIVIDIRENPFSRKPGFSKTALATALSQNSIKYIHVTQLGSPRRLRVALRQTGDEKSFFAAFKEYLSTQMQVMESLVRDTTGSTICLLCFEKDHSKCHRSVVAEKLAEISNPTVEHL